jgi:hypothetical protein
MSSPASRYQLNVRVAPIHLLLSELFSDGFLPNMLGRSVGAE